MAPLTQNQVAALCGVSPQTIAYQDSIGTIEKPTLLIGQRYFYDAEQVPRIMAALARRPNQGRGRKKGYKVVKRAS